MMRWGDQELHSYVHAVSEFRAVAEQQGKLESKNRDGKYSPKIIELEVINNVTEHSEAKSEDRIRSTKSRYFNK